MKNAKFRPKNLGKVDVSIRNNVYALGDAHGKAVARVRLLREQLAEAEANELAAERALATAAIRAAEVYPEDFAGLAEHYRVNAR